MPEERRISRRSFFSSFRDSLADFVTEQLGGSQEAPAREEPGIIRRPRSGSGPVPRGGAAPPLPIFRPPGALPEAEFLEACTRCGDCLEACPHDALKKAPVRFGPAAGTPHFDPSDVPCWMCEDMPCIASCPTDALQPQERYRMGSARIQRFDCLAHIGSTCTACSERCPVPGAIVVEAGKPRIVEEECTGCGVCAWVCPAPNRAVLMLPKLPFEP